MLSLNQVHKMYKKITHLLIQKKYTITTMESCTSGFVASLITDTEGSSAIFTGSCVTYSNEAKIMQGVEKSIIEKFGVYSVETANAMANAIMKMYPSNIAIGITGTFGNLDLNNSDSVLGKVFVSLKINKEECKEVIWEEFFLPKNISRFKSKIYIANKIGKMIIKFL